MPKRTASAVWEGVLKSGKGRMKLGQAGYEGPYSFASRFEEGSGTNPEELIGAAHAGCFSQEFSLELEQAGHPPNTVSTTATVHLEPEGEGFAIKRILLNTRAEVPGISEGDFQKIAESARTNCPVSKALAGVQIDLEAALVSA